MERAVKKEKKKRKRGKGIKLARRKKRKEKKGKGYHAGIQNKGSGSKEQIHFCDGDNSEYFVTGRRLWILHKRFKGCPCYVIAYLAIFNYNREKTMMTVHILLILNWCLFVCCCNVNICVIVFVIFCLFLLFSLPEKPDDVGVCFPVPGDHLENSSYYLLLLLSSYPLIFYIKPLSCGNELSTFKIDQIYHQDYKRESCCLLFSWLNKSDLK